MTDYERIRLENIKWNVEMLAALKVQSSIKNLSAIIKHQSVDDQVGLLSGANYEETSMVNQKSRRNSAYGFRGTWGWDDSTFFIANRKRGVDVISVAGKKLESTLYSELVSAIPSRLDAHPYKVGMLARATHGGHSGQVYI